MLLRVGADEEGRHVDELLADAVDETSGAATAAAGGGQPSNLGSVVIRGNSILQFELVGR